MKKSGPKPKTHCKNGHEMTPENTYQMFYNGVKNGLVCKICHPLAGSGKRGPKQAKFCKHGHELTPENIYQRHVSNGTKDGRKCKLCNARFASEHRQRVPIIARTVRAESHIRRKYGIDSIKERDNILKSQGGACAICGCTDCHWGKGFNKVWHIDHRHDGTVNHVSILCGRCNVALGYFEKNTEILNKFIEYVSNKFNVVLNKGEDDEKVDEKSVAWGCGFALGYS